MIIYIIIKYISGYITLLSVLFWEYYTIYSLNHKLAISIYEGKDDFKKSFQGPENFLVSYSTEKNNEKCQHFSKVW